MYSRVLCARYSEISTGADAAQKFILARVVFAEKFQAVLVQRRKLSRRCCVLGTVLIQRPRVVFVAGRMFQRATSREASFLKFLCFPKLSRL
jgi:hypothetical protein